jgi:hypothetical protein
MIFVYFSEEISDLLTNFNMKFKIFISILALAGLLLVGCDSTVYDEEKPEVAEEIVADIAKDPIPEGVVEPELNPAPQIAPVVTPPPAVLAPEPELEPVPVVVPEPIVHEASAAPMPAEPTEAPEITLAKCLTENGTKLYTASWCGHCNDQKEAFEEGLEYLNNTECAVDDGWAPVCTEAEIKGVPTWVFADGTRQSGNTPLVKLASLGGCTY